MARFCPALFAIFFLFWTPGCATTPIEVGKPPPEVVAVEKPTGESGWWQVHLHFAYDLKKRPDWHYDLLCAHRLIWPHFQRVRNQVNLWRFHRRAGSDAAGHQLSLIFYSDRSVAAAFIESVREDPLYKQLRAQGIIRDDTSDAPRTAPINAAIEGVSDPAWPIEIQREWPYYAMGISRLWLGLVSEAAKSQGVPRDSASVDDLVAFYKKVSDSVTDDWIVHGNHAFFHHLDAIFGYGPTLVNY